MMALNCPQIVEVLQKLGTMFGEVIKLRGFSIGHLTGI